jgi:hypothetical protein
MRRRRFSRPPTVGSSARAPTQAPQGELNATETRFKQTYVFERSFLEQFRGGKKYRPSPSYDGKSKWDTPEEKPVQNAWGAMWAKVQKKSGRDPATYVRILFKLLRGTAVEIPTLTQLVSPKMLLLVEEYLLHRVRDVREQFVAEGQRAKTAITIGQRGAGYPAALAVYYAITDERNGLSPLFKYCLAVGTAKACWSADQDDPHCAKLDRLAREWEFYAAMDYSLFPDDYDEVWGSTIPASFRVAAENLINAAVTQAG